MKYIEKTKVSLMAVVFTAAVLLTGCRTGNVKQNNSRSGEHGSEVMEYAYTKAQIEEEVDAKWREYGYSEKPKKFIAISFDDGPCDSSVYGGTLGLLAKLDELSVKATFFVIGQNVRGNMDAAQAIFAAGHELGNHSGGYSPLGNAKEGAAAESLGNASELIREITGKNPCFFRAPNLDHGSNLSKVCRESGMSLIDGSAHNDWPGSSAAIRSSVLNGARDGGIIILHENNTSQGNTMAALPDIVRGLREKGFWILTVGQLAAVREKTLVPGTRYSTIN